MMNIKAAGALISKINSFLGGMITNILSSNLKPYMMTACLNVLPDKNIGTIMTREGNAIMGVTPSGLPALFQFTFNKNDGTSVVLISDGNIIWSTVDFVTYVSVKTGLTITATLSAAIIRNKVWLTNGTDAVMTYNSSGTLTVLDGTAGTPNVPKGRYIIFSQERPWIGRTINNPSSVSFAALNDTTGNPIAPDNAVAWPAANVLNCDNDDGDMVYGLANFLGVPFVFKSKSFGAVTGSDEYSYGYQRVMSNVGTRFHSCIVERDGILEFVGPDGFYETQGSPETTIRVSDLIKSEFDKLLQPQVNDKNKLWTVEADWDTGTYSTDTQNGIGTKNLLQLIKSTGTVHLKDYLKVFDNFTDNEYTSNPVWTVGYGTWSAATGELICSANGWISTPNTIVYGAWEYISRVSTVADILYNRFFFVSSTNDDSTTNGYSVNMYSATTTINFILSKHNAGVVVNLGSFAIAEDTSNHTIKITRDSTGLMEVFIDGISRITATDNVYTTTNYILLRSNPNVYGGNTAYDNIKYSAYPITGTNTWISANTNIGLAADITAWGAFEAESILYGQSITYQIKSATTEAGLTAATYNTILPGATIKETLTTPWVVVKAQLISTNDQLTPELNAINLNWFIGGTSTQKMVAINYKNRNLLAASQSGFTYNNIVWVKPKRIFKPEEIPAVFIPFDWKIVSFCILNDILYAGISYNDSSATDEGAIVRLFIGKRDQKYSGAGTKVIQNVAINSYIETKDEDFELPMNKKKLMEIAVNYLPCGHGTITLERSNDSGDYVSVGSIDNTGTIRKTKINAARGVLGKHHRLKLSVNTVDVSMEIYSIEMLAVPTKVRE